MIELALPLRGMQPMLAARRSWATPDPFIALQATLESERFDEVTVSTLPHRVSHWLKFDLPARVERLGGRVTVVTGARSDRASYGPSRLMPENAGEIELQVMAVEKPEDLNVILGPAHFIKTVENLHEAVAGAVLQLRFGIAFCESSGPRLVRRSENDPELVELATGDAMAIGAGHSFIVFLRDGFPVNVLNRVKLVPEVCRIYGATANPVHVIVAKTMAGHGILGIVDGESPLGG